jgi:K+-sensing histidine kinase KdpD
MNSEKDHNALLLQVMAHDLLAPLTAIKWQTELLEHGDAGEKRAAYLASIRESTELGITLTKHAHVAGRVLVGSYAQNPVTASLSRVTQTAAEDLRPQYTRHGLTLDVSMDDDTHDRTLDVELIGLFVWSLAKYFLSCTPANTTVNLRGMTVPNAEGDTTYVVVGSAPGVPEADECVKMFKEQEARGTYDQTYVFVKLLHEVASLIGVSTVVSAQANLLVVESAFQN